ncbi:hypothetical protein [Falsiroseomonas tokyonensis]|uniref:Uncharacterized protein n=1 Tax=Falsiroseomonas tokyonensis TaxID=430521 RepID=A0ABV7BMV0_9PROT|nr:hypothetical protein [Falsiroseomonas tokyonensis]MBU8536919.1 hypothetical protein [Falsiroseomonas tokyonensis]
MRTLVLAERPGRGLRSRLLLSLLPALFPESGPLLLATPAPTAPEGFASVPAQPDPAQLGIQRVVLAGVFEEPAKLAEALAIAATALAAGAILETRAFSLARGAAPRDPPPGAELLNQATRLELRDWFTMDRILLWQIVTPEPRLVPYPEAALPPDPAFDHELPDGPLLGIAVQDGTRIRAAWPALLPAVLDALHDRLGTLPPGLPILPLPIEHPGLPEDDYLGTQAFAEALLPDRPLLLPELANPVWRRRQWSPGRLKAAVARCSLVITNQDIPAVFAQACGVPVLGLVLSGDRRVVTPFGQLANTMAPSSALLYPRPASSSARA